MKKLIATILVAVLALATVACGSAKEEGNKTQAKSGYTFESNGVKIAMNEKATPILDKLGKANKTFESKSCAFDGLDKEYTYNGFVLKTYPDKDVDYIASITLFDDTVETTEGISIGDSKENVIKAYGECKESDTVCEYKKGDMKLLFIITDDVVSSIQYVAITE